MSTATLVPTANRRTHTRVVRLGIADKSDIKITALQPDRLITSRQRMISSWTKRHAAAGEESG